MMLLASEVGMFERPSLILASQMVLAGCLRSQSTNERGQAVVAPGLFALIWPFFAFICSHWTTWYLFWLICVIDRATKFLFGVAPDLFRLGRYSIIVRVIIGPAFLIQTATVFPPSIALSLLGRVPLDWWLHSLKFSSPMLPSKEAP